MEAPETAWCVGLDEQRRRRLTDAERALLRNRLEQAKRIDRRWRLVKRGSAIAAGRRLSALVPRST